MRNLSPFLILFFLFNSALASPQQGRSQLRTQFETTGNDSIRLITSKQLFGQYVYTKADSAIYFAEQIKAIGERLELAKEVITGNTYLGIAYSIKGDFNKAGEYMQATYELHKEANDSINMAYALNNLGLNYTYAGDFLQAAENLIASARLKEALIRTGTSSYDVDLASTLLNIGIAYENQKDSVQTLRYLNQAIDEAAEVGNVTVVARSRQSLGLLYLQQEKFNQALDEFKQAEVVLDSLNDQFSLGKLYNSLALTYAGLEQVDRVIAYATKSIETNFVTGNAQAEALGLAYRGMGRTLAGQYALAIKDSKTALDYGEANQDNDVKREALKNLSEAHAAQGQFRQAYDYAVRYKEVDGLVFAKERSGQIERMSAQYEAEKREIEIDNLNKETALQASQLAQADAEKQLLFVLIGSLVVIVLLIAWFYKRILASRKALQTKNQELDRLNSTKDRFFAIISHDLRSYINAFRGNGKLMKFLLKKQETEKLEKVSAEIDKNAQNLSELLDNLLHWSLDQLKGYEPKPESVALKPLLTELLESYEPQATAKGLRLTVEMDEKASAMVDKNGLSVILRNLISNAIKFTEQGEVSIHTEEQNGMQLITVADTGMGIPKALQSQLFAISEDKIRRGTQNEKGTGLGLNLAHEFTQANHGRLEVKSEEGQGTTFLIYLPHV